MSIKDTLKKLDELYTLTKEDWVLEIHQIITEPTCPIVIIRPEGSDTMRFSVHRDSIEEGIEAAVDLVYREIVLGEHREPSLTELLSELDTTK